MLRYSMSFRAPLAGLFILAIVTSWQGVLAQQNAPPAADKPQAGAAVQGEDKTATNPEAAAVELQKAVQNPVASLISVPVQNNSNFSIGQYDRTQDVVNIQPVIPAHITKNWNLITRNIQPMVWQPYPSQPTGGEFGFGDMNPTFFLSPFKPGKVIWVRGRRL